MLNINNQETGSSIHSRRNCLMLMGLQRGRGRERQHQPCDSTKECINVALKNTSYNGPNYFNV